jgi:hypothetical protein
MAFVTERLESAQYDGTNGAALVDWLDGSYTVISDDGQLLILRDGEGTRKRIRLNGWLVRDVNRNLLWHGGNAQYNANWVAVTS